MLFNENDIEDTRSLAGRLLTDFDGIAQTIWGRRPANEKAIVAEYYADPNSHPEGDVKRIMVTALNDALDDAEIDCKIIAATAFNIESGWFSRKSRINQFGLLITFLGRQRTLYIAFTVYFAAQLSFNQLRLYKVLLSLYASVSYILVTAPRFANRFRQYVRMLTFDTLSETALPRLERDRIRASVANHAMSLSRFEGRFVFAISLLIYGMGFITLICADWWLQHLLHQRYRGLEVYHAGRWIAGGLAALLCVAIISTPTNLWKYIFGWFITVPLIVVGFFFTTDMLLFGHVTTARLLGQLHLSLHWIDQLKSALVIGLVVIAEVVTGVTVAMQLLSARMKRLPDSVLIDRLVNLLAQIDDGASHWHLSDFRQNLVFQLDQIVDLFQFYLLRESADTSDISLWKKRMRTQYCNAVRELKKWALVPKPDTRQFLAAEVSKMLVHVSLGEWDSVKRLAQLDPEEIVVQPSPLSRAADLLNTLVIGFLPLAALAVYQYLMPRYLFIHSNKPGVPPYLAGAALLWGVLTVLARMDSNLSAKVGLFKDATQLLPIPGKKQD
jgi:hypothetical protein